MFLVPSGKEVNYARQIVFTNGCFDLLHPGHLSLLCFARSLGDILIVGLNSDTSVSRLKPGRPVFNQYERRVMLESLRCVDMVFVFDEDTPENLIRIVRPNIIVKGADWEGREIAGAEFVRSYGGIVKFAPLLPEYSTTKVIERIKNS